MDAKFVYSPPTYVTALEARMYLRGKCCELIQQFHLSLKYAVAVIFRAFAKNICFHFVKDNSISTLKISALQFNYVLFNSNLY